jgi:hypothetical protein
VGGKFIFEGMIKMKSIKPKFVSSEVENPFTYEKEIPCEDARKVKDEVMEVLSKHGLTIRQAAAMLDVIKDSMLDRVIGAKVNVDKVDNINHCCVIGQKCLLQEEIDIDRLARNLARQVKEVLS